MHRPMRLFLPRTSQTSEIGDNVVDESNVRFGSQNVHKNQGVSDSEEVKVENCSCYTNSQCVPHYFLAYNYSHYKTD